MKMQKFIKCRNYTLKWLLENNILSHICGCGYTEHKVIWTVASILTNKEQIC